MNVILPALLLVYALLLIPDPSPSPPPTTVRESFEWNQDERWKTLESRFAGARQQDCLTLEPAISISLARGSRLVSVIGEGIRPPGDTLFDAVEEQIFSLGPEVAVCTSVLPAYAGLISSVRSELKRQSQHWDMNSGVTRRRMYRLLYGSRAAMEEVILQSPPGALPTGFLSQDEPSSTPDTTILGVRVHSGDILVSRGGAPTSALIARGNDYPGNFSHVALLHVEALTKRMSIIEAHIERGLAVSSLEEYLRDTKLRVLVLRLRADLAQLRGDPMLAHRAATTALWRARQRHVPYDFAMDFTDTTSMFCSEVVSSAFEQYGVRLWMGLSKISSSGVRAWLAAFGVRHFTTQEPSDLEYDPQLTIVGEWRAVDALFKDHVDNAVTDALLEGAERGEELSYTWTMLPIARVAKGFSTLLNLFGGTGPIPEGMSATAALKNRMYSERHREIAAHVTGQASIFQSRTGYVAPYWKLVEFARAGAARQRAGGTAALP